MPGSDSLGYPRLSWTVSALLREVGDLLAGRFAVCTVTGEVSGFTRASSGHCYFNLKDSEGGPALLRCAMFRRAAMLMESMPSDGSLVEVRGRIGVFEPRGELQIVVEAMRSAGAGALYDQFLRLKTRLGAEGLFDEQRKRGLRALPRAVGIVTSLGAAALHDVLTTLARRAPHVSVVLYPSPVQGSAAAAALVDAIELASGRAEVDTLIVCRGGGSLEDLWAFNEERVVRAIASASMPVISGVGHETDVTLADLAADVRAPTPTGAAELAAADRSACIEALAASSSLLQRRLRSVLDGHAQRLDRQAFRLSRPSAVLRRQLEPLALLAHRLERLPQLRLAVERTRLNELHAALRRHAPAAIAAADRRLATIEHRLASVDPRTVLSRGYAWLTDERGHAVMSSGAVARGQPLRAVLDDGTLDVVVTDESRRTSA